MRNVNLKLINTTVYNGKLVFNSFYAQESDIELKGSFDFGCEEENEAYMEKFRTGELISLDISVVSKLSRFQGSDHLGACHFKNDSTLNNQILETIEHHGMVEAANVDLIEDIQAAKKAVAAILKKKKRGTNDKPIDSSN